MLCSNTWERISKSIFSVDEWKERKLLSNRCRSDDRKRQDDFTVAGHMYRADPRDVLA